MALRWRLSLALAAAAFLAPPGRGGGLAFAFAAADLAARLRLHAVRFDLRRFPPFRLAV